MKNYYFENLVCSLSFNKLLGFVSNTSYLLEI